MPFSSWICTNNSKRLLVRIVHPGGHVELHDRPVTAAEIMSRNPRACVAYPYVFQQPWAIVAPDTVLMLGEKYYVVPISTIRKLQRLSPRNSPSAREFNISSSVEEISIQQSSKDEEDDGVIPSCCIFRNITNKLYGCKKSSRNKIKKPKNGLQVRTSSSCTELCDGSALTSRRTRDFSTGHEFRGSAKKGWSSENWQPSLESITEE